MRRAINDEAARVLHCDDDDRRRPLCSRRQTDAHRPLTPRYCAPKLAIPSSHCNTLRRWAYYRSVVRRYTSLTNWTTTSTSFIRHDCHHSFRRPEFGDLWLRWRRERSLFTQGLSAFYAYVNNWVQITTVNLSKLLTEKRRRLSCFVDEVLFELIELVSWFWCING